MTQVEIERPMTWSKATQSLNELPLITWNHCRQDLTIRFHIGGISRILQ